MVEQTFTFIITAAIKQPFLFVYWPFQPFFFSEQHHLECMQPFTKIVFQTFNQKVEIACRPTVSSDFFA